MHRDQALTCYSDLPKAIETPQAQTLKHYEGRDFDINITVVFRMLHLSSFAHHPPENHTPLPSLGRYVQLCRAPSVAPGQ